MENSSKAFRDTLALQIRGKLGERCYQLEQAEMSVFSDKLKKMMKLEIMENFKKEIDKIRNTQGYDRARQAHLEVNRAKRSLNKANLEKEILLQEYMEKLAKADENIAESQKMYEEAEMKYKGEFQDPNINTGEVIGDNVKLESNLPDEGSLEDVDEIEETQESSPNTDELKQENSDNIDSVNKDETLDTEVRIDKRENNNLSLNGTPSEDGNDFFGIKEELIGDEEAIKEDLKKNYVTIEECIDKAGYPGKIININIPRVGNKFDGYKFECFVSDEKFKTIPGVKSIHGRFLYRDDLHRLLDAINSYMIVYGITRDAYGYYRDTLGEIDSCVGMDCFKYITGLDSLYWLGWDFGDHQLNCTGKKQIFTYKNKRAHLLLNPSK